MLISGTGIISLGGGLPSSEYFPFEHFDVKFPTVGHFSEAETKTSGKIMHIGKHDVKEGRSAYDLSIALNYGQSSGAAQMVRWVTEHTEACSLLTAGRPHLLTWARLCTTRHTGIGNARSRRAARPPST